MKSFRRRLSVGSSSRQKEAKSAAAATSQNSNDPCEPYFKNGADSQTRSPTEPDAASRRPPSDTVGSASALYVNGTSDVHANEIEPQQQATNRKSSATTPSKGFIPRLRHNASMLGEVLRRSRESSRHASPRRGAPPEITLHGPAGGLIDDEQQAGRINKENRRRHHSEHDLRKRFSGPTFAHSTSQAVLDGSGDSELKPLTRRQRHLSLAEFGFGKIESYQKLELLGQGTYASVYKGRSLLTDMVVALKEIRLEPEEGAPCTAIREVSLLRNLKHANIVTLHDIIYVPRALVLVFEYMDTDLKQYMEQRHNRLELSRVKLFLLQLFRGLAFCHKQRILHRDLKPQNLLINERRELKLADFGLARAKSVPTHTYSHEVVTLWYRPPDILLGETDYSGHIDIWGAGCILYEMVVGKPLFPGNTDETQLRIIFRKLGTPTECCWPGITSHPSYLSLNLKPYAGEPLSSLVPRLTAAEPLGLDLLAQCLHLHGPQRITATEALYHPYFNALAPKELLCDLEPTDSLVDRLEQYHAEKRRNQARARARSMASLAPMNGGAMPDGANYKQRSHRHDHNSANNSSSQANNTTAATPGETSESTSTSNNASGGALGSRPSQPVRANHQVNASLVTRDSAEENSDPLASSQQSTGFGGATFNQPNYQRQSSSSGNMMVENAVDNSLANSCDISTTQVTTQPRHSDWQPSQVPPYRHHRSNTVQNKPPSGPSADAAVNVRQNSQGHGKSTDPWKERPQSEVIWQSIPGLGGDRDSGNGTNNNNHYPHHPAPRPTSYETFLMGDATSPSIPTEFLALSAGHQPYHQQGFFATISAAQRNGAGNGAFNPPPPTLTSQPDFSTTVLNSAGGGGSGAGGGGASSVSSRTGHSSHSRIRQSFC